jgi:uncharacterized protein YwbE
MLPGSFKFCFHDKEKRHPHGIKVRLEMGEVERVKEIVDES